MQFFIFFLLTAAPLPLASARPVWEWLWVCLIGLCAIIWFRRILRNRNWPTGPAVLWLVVSMAAIVVWGFFQAWGPGNVSPDPGATVATAAYFLAHLVWFLMVLAAFNTRHAVVKLVRWLGVVSVLYAAYGLVVYFTGNHMLLWYEKWAYPDSLTSTFVNRNSYAAFCGLGLQCLLADLLYRYGPALANFDRLSFSLHDFIARQMVRGLWQLTAFFILMTALLLTGSRAGIVTAFSGTAVLVFWGLLGSSLNREKGTRILAGRVVGLAVLMLVLAGIVGLSGGAVEKRLDVNRVEDARFATYPLILDAIKDRPFEGHGLGTFEEVFRLYRTEDVPVLFDRAHNDYLELAMTAGVPLALLLFTAIGVFVMSSVRSARIAGSYRIYIVLGVTTTLQLGLHSLVDFSLQMPAISYSYVSIMAASLVVAARSVAR